MAGHPLRLRDWTNEALVASQIAECIHRVPDDVVIASRLGPHDVNFARYPRLIGLVSNTCTSILRVGSDKELPFEFQVFAVKRREDTGPKKMQDSLPPNAQVQRPFPVWIPNFPRSGQCRPGLM